jgi:HK97 family phage major capsid protein
MADIRTLREKRGQLVEESRNLLSVAETEKRELTAEEDAKFVTLHAEIDKLGKDIQREERQRDLEAQMAVTADREDRGGAQRETTERGNALDGFRSWLKDGPHAEGRGLAEFRALSQGVATDGGFLVAPEQFVASLIQEVDNAVFMRGLATIYPLTGAHSIGFPTRTADVSDFDWTTELQTGSEDDALKFGKREMRAYPIAKRIKVSETLLRNGALSPEAIVRERMAYVFGITMEKAYLLGNGNQQPLGIFTASNDGVPTSRDVSTGNTATALTFDGLMSAKYSLKTQYRNRASWMFSRSAIEKIAKLKDGEGRYLWQPSVQDGQPDRILGRPVTESEYVPSTFTAGLYVGMFADFSHYWIVDSMQMQMKRLVELYAETNQIGFIARYEGDGAPTLAEAFARVKLA